MMIPLKKLTISNGAQSIDIKFNSAYLSVFRHYNGLKEWGIDIHLENQAELFDLFGTTVNVFAIAIDEKEYRGNAIVSELDRLSSTGPLHGYEE